METKNTSALGKVVVGALSWRILCFDKKGKTYKGKILFSHQRNAQAHIELCEEEMEKNIADGLDTQGGFLDRANYHWAMPIPELTR